MISYYEIIKRIFTKEEWDKLLNGEPFDEDKEEVDISPGSGFHYRQRKRHHVEKEKTA